ncbi:MAG TPA: hypothetical protein P5525_07225, partial [Candidatus Paceibacterota bacterium]|nr:hypothetical protein [Candidatus Paceibacterota bacterium]
MFHTRVASGNWFLALLILTASPCPARVGAAADASAQAESPAAAERLAVRLSWGHASDAPRTFHVALAANTVA